jgi:hypothetical protein
MYNTSFRLYFSYPLVSSLKGGHPCCLYSNVCLFGWYFFNNFCNFSFFVFDYQLLFLTVTFLSVTSTCLPTYALMSFQMWRRSEVRYNATYFIIEMYTRKHISYKLTSIQYLPPTLLKEIHFAVKRAIFINTTWGYVFNLYAVFDNTLCDCISLSLKFIFTHSLIFKKWSPLLQS